MSAGVSQTPTDAVAAVARETRTERGASTRDRSDLSRAISCGRYGHRWTGLNAAHCTGCCGQVGGELATFASPSLFDQHRRETGDRGRCMDPASIVKTRGSAKGERVMFHRDGIWRGPEMSEAEKAAAFGGAR